MGTTTPSGGATPKKVLRPVRPRSPWSGQLFTWLNTTSDPAPPVGVSVRPTPVSALASLVLRGSATTYGRIRNPAADNLPRIVPRPVVAGGTPLSRGQVRLPAPPGPEPAAPPEPRPRPATVVGAVRGPQAGVALRFGPPGPTPEAPDPFSPPRPAVLSPRPPSPRGLTVRTSPPPPGAPVEARPPARLVGRSVTFYGHLLRGWADLSRPPRDIFIEPPSGTGVPKRTLLGVDI
jgi:hypothetical protein